MRLKNFLKIFPLVLITLSPVAVFAQSVPPMDATSSTATTASLVFNEIVALPLYILQKYETPLVGMAIIIALFSAIFGVLKYFNAL